MADDPNPDPAPAGDKTFTQAELDRIVQDRLARDRKKREEELGDLDELRQKAKRADEIEAANATELEKAQKRITELETEIATARESETAAKKATLELKRDVAIREAAKAAGAVSDEAVLKLLEPDAVTIDDDGQVTGVEDAVKALLEKHEWLVGTDTPTPPTPGSGSRDGGIRTTPPGESLETTDDPAKVAEMVRGLGK